MELGVLRSHLAGHVVVPSVTTKQEFSLHSMDTAQKTETKRRRAEEQQSVADSTSSRVQLQSICRVFISAAFG